MKNVVLDMDGLFVDLYGVPNWLADLQAENVRPYIEARPLVNMSLFARTLNKLLKNGWNVSIVSWTSKNGSTSYNKAVEIAKRAWLKKHLASVHFSEINIIPYGTPKRNYGKGILFDDELKNREDWPGIAYDEKNLILNLTALL